MQDAQQPKPVYRSLLCALVWTQKLGLLFVWLTSEVCLQEGEPSYKLYAEEKTELLESLKRRAIKLHKTLSSLEGVTCTEPEGALYAMPQIRLPKAAIEVTLLPAVFGSTSACGV